MSNKCPADDPGTGKDMTGAESGVWRVLGFSHRVGKVRYWTCRCACGLEKPIDTNTLVRKTSKQCATCFRTKTRKPSYGVYFQSLRAGARKRGLEFDLTKEFIRKLLEGQGFKCALTGLPISMAAGIAAHMKGQKTASLDRKDSTRGYVPGNVHWVHKDVNGMKMGYPLARFKEICRLVTAQEQASSLELFSDSYLG